MPRGARSGEGDSQRMQGVYAIRPETVRTIRRRWRSAFNRAASACFRNEPYQDYVRETVDKLMAGELDAQLVYRKRLRRPYMSTNVTFRRTFARRPAGG